MGVPSRGVILRCKSRPSPAIKLTCQRRGSQTLQKPPILTRSGNSHPQKERYILPSNSMICSNSHRYTTRFPSIIRLGLSGHRIGENVLQRLLGRQVSGVTGRYEESRLVSQHMEIEPTMSLQGWTSGTKIGSAGTLINVRGG